MADHLKDPPNATTTSTKQNFGRGPEDMPAWKGRQGQLQGTSTTVSLSRSPNPVAAFGSHPGQGVVQVTSTKCDLSKKANGPYEHVSKTTPEVDY